MGIILKSAEELAKMQETGTLVHAILDAVEAACVPGVTTAQLNAIAARELEAAGARSAFLGYHHPGQPPFPAVLCTSVNEVIVHGLPSDSCVLREGDVIGIDFACYRNGYCADSARTVAVGVISAAARSLLDTTRECLERAIAQCHPGVRIGAIGEAVQTLAEARGFSVVRDFVGHGIGTKMHEPPSVPNFGNAGSGLKLREGMVIAIEPMVNVGGPSVRVLRDQWTIVTADKSLSAHFEHTVAITADGPRVLT